VTAGNGSSQEVLREEILAEARRQADMILRRGKAEAEAIVTKAKADAEKEYTDKVAYAKGDASCRQELVLARLPVDITRMRSARIESLLQGVYDDARRRIAAREGFDYREALITLAAEAIGRMIGTRFVLQVSDADRQALGDGWLDDLRRRVNREGLEVTFTAAPAKMTGGVIIRDADGRQFWDDSLLARLDRLWPAARRDVAVRTGLIQGAGVREEK
jgi:V/A-type H+/Na+-transporting ATPase subunit E